MKLQFPVPERSRSSIPSVASGTLWGRGDSVWARAVWSPLALLQGKHRASAGPERTRHKPACISMRGEGWAHTRLCKYFFIKT